MLSNNKENILKADNLLYIIIKWCSTKEKSIIIYNVIIVNYAIIQGTSVYTSFVVLKRRKKPH